jgi:hypothetical protein
LAQVARAQTAAQTRCRLCLRGHGEVSGVAIAMDAWFLRAMFRPMFVAMMLGIGRD